MQIQTPASTEYDWKAAWEREYGRHWLIKLGILAALLVTRGALETLSDADLPMHLAIGEWIVRHRALPVMEPFAWTRAGAPFYAYSWAMDVLMYGLAEIAGKSGLRVLHGLMMAGAAASMIYLGRAARWEPRTALLMATLNVLLLPTLVSSVRPQEIVFILVPLAWAFTFRALYSSRPRGPLIGLAVTSAIAVNTHIFFPLVIAPWLLWLADPPRERWRISGVVAVTLAGWLLTPYLLDWPQMFGSSLQPNLMLAHPTSVKEAQPGFIGMGIYWGLIVPALFLTCLPLVANDSLTARRDRMVWGFAWLIGLIAFAMAARLLLVWWLLVLPLTAAAVQRISHFLVAAEDQGRRLLRITAVWLVCVLLLLSIGPFDQAAWSFEDPAHRRLPPMRERGLDRLAQWLECNTRKDAHGRVFTIFNYGSALTWRLPQYSMSIDGRTIFPDSVVKAETYVKPLGEPRTYGPWKSAELAIVPGASIVNDVMRQESGWHQVAVVELSDGAAALWVTEKWWQRFGATPLPRHLLSLAPPEETGGPLSCVELARPAPRVRRL